MWEKSTFANPIRSDQKREHVCSGIQATGAHCKQLALTEILKLLVGLLVYLEEKPRW